MTNNEIVARFIGWTKCDCTTPETPHYKFGDRSWEVVEVVNMKFHSSLDALIPVVKKISTFDPSHFNYNVDRMSKFYLLRDSLIDLKVTAPIETIYIKAIAVVKLINEHAHDPKRLRDNTIRN